MSGRLLAESRRESGMCGCNKRAAKRPKRFGRLYRGRSNGFLVFGKRMGQKAGQLYEKASIMEAAGFVPNPRVSLGVSWFDAFRKRNGLSDAFEKGGLKEFNARMKRAKFSRREKKVLLAILERFEGQPLFVRSSAEGDARGTGVYYSGLCPNNRGMEENLARLEEVIKTVLKSEFDYFAVGFRKLAGLKDGMGVIIEPAFGCEYTLARLRDAQEKFEGPGGYKVLCPDFSGCGYTSTPSGEGYLQLVAGIPAGAVGGWGFKVSLNKENVGVPLETLPKTKEEKDRFALSFERREVVRLDKGGVYPLWGRFKGKDTGKATLEVLARKLQKLEELAGLPQYVEIGVVIGENGKQEHRILQIADVVPNKDSVEFPENPRGVLLDVRGKSSDSVEGVVGEGRCVCSKTFALGKREGAEELLEFNERNRGYLLIAESGCFGGNGIMPYSHFSNASAIVAWKPPFSRHAGAAEHVRGMLAQAGKLFMVADWGEEAKGTMLEKAGMFRSGREGAAVGGEGRDYGLVNGPLDLNVEIIASEKQGRGLVRLLDAGN